MPEKEKNNKTTTIKNKVKKELKEWWNALWIALILAVIARTFLFQMYKIPTTSMVPTLMPGDKIFVTKLTYGPKIPFMHKRIPGSRKPDHGDIVVFVPPIEKEKNIFQRKRYVKRLIAVGGDRVLIKDGNVYVNDKIVTDPRYARNYYYNQGAYADDNVEINVPENKYFFLGDNSISSYDSRFWGFVDESDIIGRAVFIWWPYKRFGVIE
ncbi:MAG: signal peptidase I [Candidatus Omnitrophica bacterium]|nr:signal peptidase I [Candidatus Omnitrophota bacterium]MDD5080811.1 signal peptidase I [Candidatus Omnitrophota bacterium]MDD5441248.1 signal peptidase I [Candidatus Omnitrophota bacterium]